MSSEEGSDSDPLPPKILPKRSTRGVRLTDIHGEGDDEFWQQEFWEDKQEDTDFEISGEEGEDVVDSDFDDTEDESDEEEVVVAKEKTGKRNVYVDPRKKKEKATKADGEAPPAKRQKTVVAPSNRSKRKSTQKKTEKLEKIQKKREEARSKRVIRRKKKAGKVLTQEERLLEAKKTEKINRQSLQALLRIEEMQKQQKAVAKKRVTGPRVLYISKVEGAGAHRTERSLISFSSEHSLGLPAVLRQQLPAFVVKTCAGAASQVAKYKDPKTGMTFASADMFRAIRSGAVKGGASSLLAAGGAASLLMPGAAPVAAPPAHKGPGRPKKRKLGS